MAPPEDLDLICQDLKVCGRRELFSLLKFRHKYQRLVDHDRKTAKAEADKRAAAEAKVDKGEQELEEENDKELEETIKRVEKERKKQDKKERERKAKAEIRAKMSVIASTDIYNQNDDVLFDRRTLDKLKKVDIEELEYNAPDSQEELSEGELGGAQIDGKGRKKVSEDEADDDESVDEETKRFEEMAAGIDEYYARQKEYKMEIDRQLQKKDKKRQILLEQQRLKREDVSEEEELQNDDVKMEEGKVPKKKAVKFESESEDDEDGGDDGGLFVNPLLAGKSKPKKKKAGSDEESESDQHADDESGSGFSSADEADERAL